MRGTRWLLLVAIAAILVGVSLKYRELQHAQTAETPPKPNALPASLQSKNQKYHWMKKGSNDLCARAEVEADELEAERDSHHANLVNVELKLYSKSCTSYDLIKSQAATLYENDHRLFSDGPVAITINIPTHPDPNKPPSQPITVESSAVTFDTDTGRAETDKPTHFIFARGDGDAVGAVYDPTNRVLELKSAVVVNYKPIGPHAKPMKIEAGNLVYREADSEVLLKPWGRMTREDTQMEGNNVVVHLQSTGSGPDAKHSIKQVQAEQAHGTEADKEHNRKLNYAADRLVVDYNATGQVQAIGADGNARMVSTAETAETTITGNHVEMAFTVENKESHLARVVAEGHGEVAEKPLPAAGREPGESHILRSDNLEMKMRPGGKDIESVVTHSPGSLEFLPNQPTQHHRTLDGSRMTILYAAQNRIEQFHVSDARTRTDPTADEKKHNRGVSTTVSKDLSAHFDTKTGKLASMEQTENFSYSENDRKASAAKATLDNDVIVLDTNAHMSDASSSTSADRIRMDQHTGDFSAEGHVKSSRTPESDPSKTSEMLNGDQPLQAEARKMETRDRNRSFHYEGDVAMWQGANRITADVVDVNHEKKMLKADGHVVTTFYDQPKDKDQGGSDNSGKSAAKTANAKGGKSSKSGKPAAPKAPVKTVVQAPHLVYTDADRLAVYSGGVILDHAGTHVTSNDLRAYLADSDADSRLQNAIADGNVQIKWSNPQRVRTGTGQHAEYYTDDERVLLTGGRPKFADSCKGNTEGEKLTYFANDDRLLVNGQSSQPAQSRIDRSCK